MAKNDFWILLDNLQTRMPLDPQRVQDTTGVALKHVKTNEYTDFFQDGSAHLADGVDIEQVDLRVSQRQPRPVLLVLSLSGRCVERSAVLSRYQGLQITDHPRSTFPNEQTYWSKQLPWGKLSFGFAQGNPDCLRTVVLNAMQTEPSSVWTLIDDLRSQAPFTKDKAERALGMVLLPTQTGDAHSDSFKGGPAPLPDGIAVAAVELHIRKSDPAHKWVLSLRFVEPRLDRSQVLARYPGLKLTDAAPNDGTSWSRQEPWGRLSFEFEDGNREYLRRIVFSGPAW